ncbi:MAG: ABC transporter ATP-binding protein [Candidatus Kapaibacteriota bacterium]
MLIVSDLSKNYGAFRALDSISFSAESGKICGIVGPNGAGKTTTIRIILGILGSDGGSISYKGKTIHDIPRSAFGYLPEERGLYKQSTVNETLMYLGALKQHNKHQLKQQIDSWLERFLIPEYKHKKIEELSKGNQQKIQFIASVLHDPELLIIDEPLSGLDPLNQELFKDIVKELRNKGKIIIFCTHQLGIAEVLCDSIIMLNKGKIAMQGVMNDLLRSGTHDMIIEFATLHNQEFPHECRKVSDKQWIFPNEHASIQEVVAQASQYGEILSMNPYRPTLLGLFRQHIEDAEETAS